MTTAEDVPAPGWPPGSAALAVEQERLALFAPPPWQPQTEVLVVGGFLAYAPGEQGPGRAGDHGWAAAAVVECPGLVTVATSVVACIAGAAYARGQLALREGPALDSAVRALHRRPDVLLVDATGRDHPRGAGLALQLGAVLDVPTVGVTHRTLVAEGDEPELERGDRAPLWLDGDVVGAWVRTQRNVRPLAVHAAWRVDVDTAVSVVLASTATAEPPNRCAAPADRPEGGAPTPPSTADVDVTALRYAGRTLGAGAWLAAPSPVVNPRGREARGRCSWQQKNCGARLRRRLVEEYGVDEADMLLDPPPGGWEEVVTRDRLQRVLDARIAPMEQKLASIDSRLTSIEAELRATPGSWSRR